MSVCTPSVCLSVLCLCVLPTKAVTGLRLEQLKLQLAEEIEEPFRRRTDVAETELESLRSEYNRLRYSCSFLKSQYEALEVSDLFSGTSLINRGLGTSGWSCV